MNHPMIIYQSIRHKRAKVASFILTPVDNIRYFVPCRVDRGDTDTDGIQAEAAVVVCDGDQSLDCISSSCSRAVRTSSRATRFQGITWEGDSDTSDEGSEGRRGVKRRRNLSNITTSNTSSSAAARNVYRTAAIAAATPTSCHDVPTDTTVCISAGTNSVITSTGSTFTHNSTLVSDLNPSESCMPVHSSAFYVDSPQTSATSQRY